MPHTTRITLALTLLALLAGSAGARIVEVNPYRAGALSEWTLTPEDQEAWSVSDDVLSGETKAFFEADAIFDGETLDAFSLFVQVDAKHRKLSILLVPESGERVEIEVDRKWIDRRSDFTMLKIDVGGGKYTVYKDEEEQESREIPDVAYKVGFHLGKSGKAQLKRIRLTFDRKPPPAAPVPEGFVDLLEESTWNRLFAQLNIQNQTVPGQWTIQDGVLTGRNPEDGGQRGVAARVLRAQAPEYELRFKVRTGARGLRMVLRMGIQGQENSGRIYALDGYCTSAEAWNTFVVRYGNGQLSLNANGLDVIPGESVVAGPTGVILVVDPGGEWQIRDFHLRMPGLSAPSPAAGGGQPAAGGGGAPGTIFDGKSLETFATHPQDGVWEVVDRAILGLNGSGAQASLLYRLGRVADYTLKFRVEMGTQGLAVVAKYNPDARQGTMVEVPAAALRRPYNDCQVIVRGTEVRLLVNGQQVSQPVNAIPGSWIWGFVLQAGGRCRIRDIELAP